MPRKPRERKSARVDQLREYNRMLSKVRRLFGHVNSTSQSELEQMLKKLNLQPAEVGTKALYEKREDNLKGLGSWRSGSSAPPKYGIYNTMYKPPGEHWFCCFDDYMYDPLGKDASKTQEQPYNTDDCGQRCIAYLLLCKRHGYPLRI